MKKTLIIAAILLLASIASLASIVDEIDPQGVSLKAGPTDPSEGISIAWIETALYPKNIEKGNEVFLEVTSTSKVKNVSVQFDFDKGNEKTSLSSNNSLTWSKVCKLPQETGCGVHFAKVVIEGRSGAVITRTLEFSVIESDKAVAGQLDNYPVTVLKDASAFADGKILENIKAGSKVTALYKEPFYKVKLPDSREGWIEASKVKEPTEEYYILGYKFYLAKQYDQAKIYYSKALELNPYHVRAHYWLAKTFIKLGEETAAIQEIKTVVKLSPDFEGVKELANSLLENNFNYALSCYYKGDLKEALGSFRKVLDLNPTSLTSWIKLGETYRKMGLQGDAKLAFREALRVDPENEAARSLLGIKEFKEKPAYYEAKKQNNPQGLASKPVADDSKQLVSDSIKAVQDSKTNKGTRIASAVKSVLSLTKSLGTQVKEDGWQVKTADGSLVVKYICKQERNGKSEIESFDWKIDPDSKRILASNDNSRLLMSRW